MTGRRGDYLSLVRKKKTEEVVVEGSGERMYLAANAKAYGFRSFIILRGFMFSSARHPRVSLAGHTFYIN